MHQPTGKSSTLKNVTVCSCSGISEGISDISYALVFTYQKDANRSHSLNLFCAVDIDTGDFPNIIDKKYLICNSDLNKIFKPGNFNNEFTLKKLKNVLLLHQSPCLPSREKERSAGAGHSC